MLWKRVAGVIVTGMFIAGCAQHTRETPKASSPAQPMDEGAVATLEQSWRAAHPGSLIGHVNAVAPDRHVLSVAGLPLDQIHEGDVVTILPNGQTNNVVSARVFGKDNGFAQLDYGGLQVGQSEPRQGDLAIWYSGGLTPNEEASAASGAAPAIPTTQPGATTPDMAPTTPPSPTPAPTTPAPAEATPPPPAPPAPTTPAADSAAPPATAPAAPAAGTPTPPPAPGDNKLPSDLNK